MPMPISSEVAAVVAASWFALTFAFAWWRGDARPRRIRDLAKEGALIVDVRSAAQFAEGHVAGAINIPAAELALRQAELGEHDHAVLVYGRTSLASAVAAQKLRTIGFHTIMTVGTMARWNAGQHPIEA